MTKHITSLILFGQGGLNFWKVSVSRIQVQKLSLLVVLHLLSNGVLLGPTTSPPQLLLLLYLFLCLLDLSELPKIARKLLIRLPKVVGTAHILIDALILCFCFWCILNNSLSIFAFAHIFVTLIVCSWA